MNECNKISPLALGLSLGVLSGITVIVVALLSLLLNGKPVTLTLSGIALEYEFTLLGSFLGGFLTFIHGLIVGALIGGLYNYFLGCCSRCCETKKPKAKAAKTVKKEKE